MEKPKCESCGSTQMYFRFKTSELVCKTCGHCQKKEQEVKDEK